jgi:hypothetical protein
MRRLLTVGTGIAAILFTSSLGYACGEKFVVLGKGIRFQHAYAAAHPASILLYMTPGSRLAELDPRLQIQSTLKLAGHRVRVIEDPAGLSTTLESGRYDIVVADVSDGRGIGPEVRGASARPTLLLVAFDDAEIPAASEGCLVKVSRKNPQLLAALDETMQGRLKHSSEKCPR